MKLTPAKALWKHYLALRKSRTRRLVVVLVLESTYRNVDEGDFYQLTPLDEDLSYIVYMYIASCPISFASS